MKREKEESLGALKDLSAKFLSVERRLRARELDRIDLQHSLRMLFKALLAILVRRGGNDDLVDILRGFEKGLGDGKDETSLVSLTESVAEAVSKLSVGSTKYDGPESLGAQKSKETLSEALINDFLSSETPDNSSQIASIKVLIERLKRLENSCLHQSIRALSLQVEDDFSFDRAIEVLGDQFISVVNNFNQQIGNINVRLLTIFRAFVFKETEFSKIIDQSISFLSGPSNEYNNKFFVSLNEINGSIEQSVKGDNPESLISFLHDKIDGLFVAVRKKSSMDSERLETLIKEKQALQSHLDLIRRDYDSFMTQSHQTLRELETAKSISLRDPLTSLYNRRAYDEQIRLTIDNYRAGQIKSFSLLIFDLDFFREINNTYGHQAGDNILTNLGRIIKDCLRSDDLIFRYGGDEFIVILPESELKDAINVAEKLRRNIEAVEFFLSHNSDKCIRLTISVGLSVSKKGDTTASILARADKALYASKNKGRNQVSW
ncbi:MAG: GGDEF domain-containing protein [Deltaproteobacteria bacterium]|jgi:diguanylate cyclase (GGDEF)-like protein|nr:GGDEF domain-containing protein [Deltaproteobacteria bacterium]